MGHRVVEPSARRRPKRGRLAQAVRDPRRIGRAGRDRTADDHRAPERRSDPPALRAVHRRRPEHHRAALDAVPARPRRRVLRGGARVSGILVRGMGLDGVGRVTAEPSSRRAPHRPAAFVQEKSAFILDLAPTWAEFRRNLGRNIKESLRKCYNSLKRDGLGCSLHILQDPREISAGSTRFLRCTRRGPIWRRPSATPTSSSSLGVGNSSQRCVSGWRRGASPAFFNSG